MQKQTILRQGLLSASLFSLMCSTHAQESVSSFEQSLINNQEPAEQTQFKKSLNGIPANFDMQALTNELKARGWVIQHKADGSLILKPDSSLDSSSGTKADKNTSTNGQWQQLQQKFQNAGWSAVLDENGDMRLTPPSPPADTKSQAGRTEIKSNEDSSFEAMQQKLKKSGWDIRTNSDNSVLLFPPKRDPSKLNPSKELISKKLHPCPGVRPAVKVSLPVDSWQEAHDIAQGWLETVSITHSTVGKIRKIFNVYIISIVSDKAPFSLMHQIAIKNSNGAIILLH